MPDKKHRKHKPNKGENSQFSPPELIILISAVRKSEICRFRWDIISLKSNLQKIAWKTLEYAHYVRATAIDLSVGVMTPVGAMRTRVQKVSETKKVSIEEKYHCNEENYQNAVYLSNKPWKLKTRVALWLLLVCLVILIWFLHDWFVKSCYRSLLFLSDLRGCGSAGCDPNACNRLYNHNRTICNLVWKKSSVFLYRPPDAAAQ